MAYIELPKLYHPDYAWKNRKPVFPCEIADNKIANSLSHLYVHARGGGHDLCGRGGPLVATGGSGAVVSKSNFTTTYNTTGYWEAAGLSAPANEITVIVRQNISTYNNNDIPWGFLNSSDTRVVWEYLYNGDLRHRADSSSNDLHVGTGNWKDGVFATRVFRFSATLANCQIWEDGIKLPLTQHESSGNTAPLVKLQLGDTVSTSVPTAEYELIGIFDRVLSDAEAAAVSRDVYGTLLKPTVPLFYFTSAGGGVSIAPSQGSIAIAGAALGSLDLAMTPGLGSMSIAGAAVSLTQAVSIGPALGTLSVAGQSVTLDIALSPLSDSVSITGQSVSVAGGTIITPEADIIAIAGQNVDFSALTSIDPGLATISVAGLTAPSFDYSVFIEPGTATILINGQSITVDAVFATTADGVVVAIIDDVISEVIDDVMVQ